MISHVKIVAFQTITSHSFWTFYIGRKPVVYIIDRKIHGCLEIPDLFLVLNMIFLTRSRTQNKSGISAHPCIILYLFTFLLVQYGGMDNKTIGNQACAGLMQEVRFVCTESKALRVLSTLELFAGIATPNTHKLRSPLFAFYVAYCSEHCIGNTKAWVRGPIVDGEFFSTVPGLSFACVYDFHSK